MHLNPVVRADEVPEGWSPEVADIINGLICRKDQDRLGNLGVKSVMLHPWFKNVNWKDLEYKRVEAPFLPNNVSCYDIKDKIDEFFDEAYLQSFEKSSQIPKEIINAENLLRKPNTHKQFKDFYYNIDGKIKKKSHSKSLTPTTLNSYKTTY